MSEELRRDTSQMRDKVDAVSGAGQAKIQHELREMKEVGERQLK